MKNNDIDIEGGRTMTGMHIKINAAMCRVLLKHLDTGNAKTPDEERRALFEARRMMILCAARDDKKSIMQDAKKALEG